MPFKQNVGGVFKDAVPFVNVGGVWGQATPWEKVNGVWLNANPLISFTQLGTIDTGLISNISYGNGVYVGVGDQAVNTGASMKSSFVSTDLITWTEHNTMPVQTYWKFSAFGNGVFVAMSVWMGNLIANLNIAVSSDGITWTDGTIPETFLLIDDAHKMTGCTGLIFANGFFWASYVYTNVNGTGASYVYKSTDGITWTLVFNTGDYLANVVHLDGDLFGISNRSVFGQGSRSNHVLISSDGGVTWNTKYTPVSKQWNDMAFGNGAIVVINGGDNSNFDQTCIVSSNGGNSWVEGTLPVACGWSSIGFSNGKFLAIGTSDYYNGTTVSGTTAHMAISTDGIHWTEVSYLTGQTSIYFAQMLHDVDGSLVITGNPHNVLSTSVVRVNVN